MEILERAKGDHGDGVPFTAKEEDLRDEVNHRTWKAGYTTRHGECPQATKIMARGFGESKLNIWPRDKDGNLIE